MRENLFHGKRKDNGKWVEGYYVPVGEYHYILTGKLELVSYLGFEHFLVIPETVGQYAGLTDKNGKKIFEGDIVRYDGEKHIVVFETRGETGYFGIKIDRLETWNFCLSVPAKSMEVIGNIYDNPELIGGRTNE